MEILVVVLLAVLGFVGYQAAVAQKKINELNQTLKERISNEMDLIAQLHVKSKQLTNLQKTNTLLKAKVDSQEQNIKKISQFFAK